MNAKLTGIPETLLIPLWARAKEGEMPNPIMRDTKASKMLTEIDYDFSKFEKSWLSQLGVAIRTMLLDNAVSFFLEQNPEAVVINLGAGLDTRHERLGAKNIDWYELDVPESIALRRKFFKETPRYHFVEKSMLEESWMEEINDEGRPVLLIAEGLFMYFSEEELRPLFSTLVKRFPEAEVLFEMLPPIMVGKSKHHDSLSKMEQAPEFKWGLKESRDLEQWEPEIRFQREWNYYDYYKSRWKWFGYIARFPLLRAKMACRIVNLRFV